MGAGVRGAPGADPEGGTDGRTDGRTAVGGRAGGGLHQAWLRPASGAGGSGGRRWRWWPLGAPGRPWNPRGALAAVPLAKAEACGCHKLGFTVALRGWRGLRAGRAVLPVPSRPPGADGCRKGDGERCPCSRVRSGSWRPGITENSSSLSRVSVFHKIFFSIHPVLLFVSHLV